MEGKPSENYQSSTKNHESYMKEKMSQWIHMYQGPYVSK